MKGERRRGERRRAKEDEKVKAERRRIKCGRGKGVDRNFLFYVMVPFVTSFQLKLLLHTSPVTQKRISLTPRTRITSTRCSQIPGNLSTFNSSEPFSFSNRPYDTFSSMDRRTQWRLGLTLTITKPKSQNGSRMEVTFGSTSLLRVIRGQ